MKFQNSKNNNNNINNNNTYIEANTVSTRTALKTTTAAVKTSIPHSARTISVADKLQKMLDTGPLKVVYVKMVLSKWCM